MATDNSLQPQSLRFTAYRNDHTGGLLGPLKATQVAIGDVQTQAGQLIGQTSVGRGAFVSNQPIGRISRFSTTTLRGTLPNGWDAELYRNGQLLAFQQSNGDGRYEFLDVELFYGRNELEVVLYGPQLIQVSDTIAAGPQKWRWGVGVERGLNERTSAALGVQSMFFSGRRRQGRLGSINYGFDALWTFGDFKSEFVAQNLDRKYGFGFDTSLRMGKVTLPVQAFASHSQLRDGANITELGLKGCDCGAMRPLIWWGSSAASTLSD